MILGRARPLGRPGRVALDHRALPVPLRTPPGLAGVVIAIVLESDSEAAAAVSTATAAFLVLSFLLRRRSSAGRTEPRSRCCKGSLLVDGLYLATVWLRREGPREAIQLLPYVHVVGVTLLCSYRTGLKLALWHTLLLLLVIEAARTGVLHGRMAAGFEPAKPWSTATEPPSPSPGSGCSPLGTALFSAASERQLRRQKHDLSRLSAMVARVDTDPEAADIPDVLLEELVLDLRIRARRGPRVPARRPRPPRLGRDARVRPTSRSGSTARCREPGSNARASSCVPSTRTWILDWLRSSRRPGTCSWCRCFAGGDRDSEPSSSNVESGIRPCGAG